MKSSICRNARRRNASRNLTRISLAPVSAFLLICLSLFPACKKTDTNEGYDVLSFSDDTGDAAELVQQANEDLNKIKILYKKNESQLEDLKAAMSGKDAETVRKITNDLVYVLNEGLDLGEKAVEKIGKAQQKNINPEFKEYLSLKEESLQKQLDAFENRRQAARLLRDSFGTTNPAAIEKAKAEFKEKEEKCVKMLEESNEINKKANQLAKDSSRKN